MCSDVSVKLLIFKWHKTILIWYMGGILLYPLRVKPKIIIYNINELKTLKLLKLFFCQRCKRVFATFVLFSPNGAITAAQLERPHASSHYYFMRFLLI